MKKYVLLLAIALVSTFSFAQKTFTVEESVLLERTLQPERVQQLDWIPGGDRFAYVKQIDGDWQILAGEAGSTKREVLVHLADLNAALKAAGYPEKTAFPAFRLISATQFRFFQDTDLCLYDWVGKKVQKVTSYKAEGQNIDISDAHSIAYTIDQNLYVSLPGKPDVAVTNESNVDIRHGESAHRNEFGINKGTFWSPKGDLLAFYRVDERMVTHYPILNLREHPATEEIIKYPFAGEKSHHATVGVYNSATGKTTYLQTGGDPEHYLSNITWSPDQKSIYIAELNRDQNHVTVNRYSAETGMLEKTLFEEKHEKYVEPKHGPEFLPGKPGQFLWYSQRDGWNNLYLYDTEGKLLGQVTKCVGSVVTDILGFDAKGTKVYVAHTANNGLDRMVSAYDLAKFTAMPMVTESGTHTAILSSTGAYFIDQLSNLDTPNRTTIRETKKATVVQELLNAADPLKDYQISRPKLFTIKAADGKTDLNCRLIGPANFNEDAVYPVLVYVYNGPGVQLLAHNWMASAPLWMQYLSQKGYYVFTVDGRGTANMGRDFEQASFKDLGTVEIADQLKGVEYLKGLQNVDKNRMVVHGWSYGGFMTCNLMLRAPGTFKAGVAGGPVTDWSLYEIMYTERYMDTPETNKAGYDNSLVSKYIKDLKGKLMLIHGTSDDVVVWQHSLDLVEKAVTNGVQLDYFVYPNHPHNVRGKDRAHLMRKVLDYLMENNK